MRFLLFIGRVSLLVNCLRFCLSILMWGCPFLQRFHFHQCEQSEKSGFAEERALNLTYKRATIEDIDILTETRIEVLRAANKLSDDIDMSEVQEQSYGYYKKALCNGTHIAYLILAEKYGADKEVVLIAAWLHDIASITDYSLYDLHHIHGAEMAYSILKEYRYDSQKIRMVQECIKNHRGSVNLEKNSLEELCVADADAISHFDSVPSLLYLVY